MAGSRIKGITVEIGGDTTGLEKALKNVNSSIKNTQSKLKDVQRLLKLDPSNTELVTQKQKLLKEAIASTSEKLETLKEAQRQAKELLENGELGRDKYDALQREIIETEEELRRLQKEAEATNAILEKLGRLGSNLEKAGQAITNAGKKAMIASGAVIGIGTAAVKTTAEFDSSMSKVAAISGATGEDLDALRTKAREMGAATKFSASEAADAMTYMAMAGWKTDDMLSGIEGIMNLAAASGEDLATTSDIVTDALTAFGLQASDSTHFADVLAAASSNSNTNVAMMGETFKYCAPIAGALGYSVEDCAEMIGLMANAGIKSTQAGTAMRTIMTKLQGKLKLSGKAFGKVRIATTNADGSMREMGEIIGDLRGYFSQMTESEKAAAAQSLVGKNAMSGFLALMNAAPEDVQKLNSSILGCDGAAAHMAEVMQDNLSGQLTILKSKLQELAISFGEILMPVIRKVITFVQGLIDKLNNMDEATKERIVKIAAIIAAIGPLLLILGKLLTVLGGGLKGFVSIAKGIGKMKAAAKAGTGVIGKLTGAFGGSLAGLLAVVAAIAALVLAFRHLWNTNEGFRERMTAIWDGIKQKVSSFCSAITERINALGFDFGSITEVLKAVWDKFCQLLAPVFEGAFRSISIILSTVLDALLILFDVFAAIFSGDWESAWEGIKTFFRTIWDGICQFFENKWETIKEVLNTVLGWFGLTWEEAWTAVSTFFTDVWTGISTFFSETLDTICTTASTVWESVKEYVVTAWESIKSTVSTIAKTVAEKVSTAFESLKEAVGTLWEDLKTTVSTSWATLKETISSAWSRFTTSVSTAFSSFVTTAGTLLEPIISTVTGIWEDMKTAIGTKFTEIIGVISETWENLKQGVSEAWTAFTTSVSEALAPFIETFAGLIAPFVEKVKDLWESIKTAVSEKWAQLKESISLGWEAFKESVASVLTAYVTTIATLLAPFVEAVTTLWNDIKTAISTKWAEVKESISIAWTTFMTSVSTALTTFVTSFTTLLEPFVTAASTAWENVKTAISTKIDEIVTAVTTVFTNLDTDLSTAFETIKTTAETVWEKIKTAITTPIENAKTFIGEAIGSIETFFANCKMEFPKIKLPHFSIVGSFSLNPISVPKLSISWYRKGGILTDPTVFGMNGMSLMAGGEAGPEAILPLKPFYEKLEALLDKGQRENVINIYPQNLTEAQIDYLFARFNAKLGGSRV